MSEENDRRQFFLGAAALTVAAAELSLIGSEARQSGKAISGGASD